MQGETCELIDENSYFELSKYSDIGKLSTFLLPWVGARAARLQAGVDTLRKFRLQPMLIALVCLVVYPIGKDLNLRIQNELEERRKKFAS